MSLIRELGVDYIRDRFNGCMFNDADGNVRYIDSNGSWPRNKVSCFLIKGTAEHHEVLTEPVADSFFKDLSVFKVPHLGWRMSEDGTLLINFCRNNKSYQRAVSIKVLQKTMAPSTAFLVDTENLDWSHYCRESTIATLIMRPMYVAFREGIQQMKAGNLFSFCVNPNLAVIPEVEDQQALYFNTTKIGVVNQEGTIICSNNQVLSLIKDITQ